MFTRRFLNFWIFLSNNYNYQIPILLYHSIGLLPHMKEEDKNCNICVSEERFREEMTFLFKHRYKVISSDQLVNLIGKKTKQRNFVVITFDDGYENNYTKAYPVLKRYKFPATIFMIARKVGEDGYLNEEELKELTEDNITIGSHTSNHKYLPDLTQKELIPEILESKNILEDIIQKRVDFLSYPIGGFNKEIQDLVRIAGYKATFTTNRGIKKTKRDTDIYALKRIKITERDCSFKFWAKTSGFYHLFRRIKSPE